MKTIQAEIELQNGGKIALELYPENTVLEKRRMLLIPAVR